MKIIYNNLYRRLDRRSHMESMLNDLDVDYERFNAIDPTIDEIKHGKYKNFYKKAVPRFKKYVNTPFQYRRAIGVFGVYLSHLIIHESQTNNPDPYIILEDDVVVTKNTFFYLNDIINYLDSCGEEWDIIRSLWDSNYQLQKIKGVNSESLYSKKNEVHNIYGGAHFGVFKNAKKILNYLESEYVFAIDGIYTTCILNVYEHDLDVLLDDFYSDIPKIEDLNYIDLV